MAKKLNRPGQSIAWPGITPPVVIDCPIVHGRCIEGRRDVKSPEMTWQPSKRSAAELFVIPVAERCWMRDKD